MPLTNVFVPMRPISLIRDVANSHVGRARHNLPTFLYQINLDRERINLMIDRYNQVSSDNDKRNILNDIISAKASIETKYPSSCLAHFADITTEFDMHLFNEIQKQSTHLNTVNPTPTTKKRRASLPTLIEQMRPEKLVQLMQILQKGAQFNLDELTALYDRSDQEFTDYQTFLRAYTPVYLGGGNSKNFSFIPLNKRDKPVVLKLENRLDQPGMAERHLRSSSLQQVMMPISAKRQATYTYSTPRLSGYSAELFSPTQTILTNKIYVIIRTDFITYSYLDANKRVQTDTIDLKKPEFSRLKSIQNNSLEDLLPGLLEVTAARGQTPTDTVTVNRSLVVTDLCEGGNLEKHSFAQSQSTPNHIRTVSALNIYRQMCTILLNISNDNCAFPDMKNTNWLIDKKGVIQIADTKSFVFTDAFGRLDTRIPENERAWVTQTPYVSPPEILHYDENTPCSADNMHAYMLGKNLYQYLTCCDYRYLSKHKSADTLSFGADVFKPPEGILLKELILSLVKKTAPDRRSISDALLSLNEIQRTLIHGSIDKYRSVLHICGSDSDSNLVSLLDELQLSQDVDHSIQLQQQVHLQLKPKLQAYCLAYIDKLNITHAASIIRKDTINQTTDFNELMHIQQKLEQEVLKQLSKQCADTNSAISKQQFGDQDPFMIEFILDNEALIKQSTDVNDLEKIHQRLNVILAEQQSPSITSLKYMLNRFRENNIYHLGGSNKAKQIELAILKIPVTQRKNIDKLGSVDPDILKVQKLLKQYCPTAWSKSYFKQALPTMHSTHDYKDLLQQTTRTDEQYNPMLKSPSDKS